MKPEKSDTLVIASHNPGKITEIRDLLHPFFSDIKNASDFHLEEPEETGSTFRENALIKARAVTQGTGFTSIADDSGLVVSALDGEPGVYSARWAGPSKDFYAAINKIEKKLKEKNATDYSARFVCALALCFPDGKEKVVQGEITGTLTFPPRGTNGFGFDPIFIANGMMETYGEIAPELKNAINHRAVAFRKLKKSLTSQ
jgi:XTP/dITP diphosphohydrolase